MRSSLCTKQYRGVTPILSARRRDVTAISLPNEQSPGLLMIGPQIRSAQNIVGAGQPWRGKKFQATRVFVPYCTVVTKRNTLSNLAAAAAAAAALHCLPLPSSLESSTSETSKSSFRQGLASTMQSFHHRDDAGSTLSGDTYSTFITLCRTGTVWAVEVAQWTVPTYLGKS